ncbi:MAG: DUF5710 domain-containing protein [Bacteroidota bacterium]
MRLNLKVPFAEKDAAKKLGARWDATRKIWYVDKVADMAPFAKWLPIPDEGSAAAVPAELRPGARQQSTGKVIVGSEYVERSRLCACLPWEVCDHCRATALSA